MRHTQPPDILDVSALRMRQASIATGILLSFAVCVLGEVYVALTWQDPHRAELAVLFGVAFVANLGITLLPQERIVRGPLREPFFLSWTLMDLLLIVLATVADGGARSPIVLLFFMPVVFSSMSYPLWSVVVVGVLSVASYLGVALFAASAGLEQTLAFVTVLSGTGAMSAWQARNHHHQHLALADASRTDPLTGCLNRRGFEELANAEIAAMRRRGRAGAVLVMDIDHFKPVNDRFGHAAGDELLCWVSATLRNAVRSIDAVGRLGGDEFAVLFPDVDAEHARRTAARVKEALAERAPASLGLAIYPEDGWSLEELSRRADLRLYASREGRPVPAAERERDGRPAPEQLRVPAFLLDEIDASVIVVDMDGTIISWNRGAEELHGYKREEAVGRPARELVVPDDRQPSEQLGRELRRDRAWEGEMLVRRRDGSTFTAYSRNRLVLDAKGQPVAVVGVSVDISERVAVETALLRSRNYAEAVTECMGEGLFTLDDGGRVTYVNPAAETMLGWPRGELRGRVMHEVIHHSRPDGSPRAVEECAIMAALRGESTVRIDEDQFLTRSGRELPVAYSATPFTTIDGERGCVVIFEDATERRRQRDRHEHDAATLACINRVEQALAEDRFELFAQPIVDLRSGAAVQHELLLRMRERDGRIVAPGEYLHVAEQYAMIGEIDWWVIKRAAQIASSGCPVELNVSARSIGDLDVLEHIERCIEQYAVPPGTLVFEITETAIVEDERAARAFAERLHALGCKLALDDFGTGYGGFTYLKQIPVDYLKIDIEFVRDLRKSPASHHVVQAVVALARDFDLQTVAEGVEDEETLGLLRELGVDFAQGYAIARPAPFDSEPGDRREDARTGRLAALSPARRASRRRAAVAAATPSGRRRAS